MTSTVERAPGAVTGPGLAGLLSRAGLGTSPRAAGYYANGWWRPATFIDDLREAAARRPGDTIFINWRQDLGREVVVSIAELADYVGRLSAGLRGLGLCPGDAVVVQLPNWWEAAAVLLACLDAGLIVVPLAGTLGLREVERVLSGTGAKACMVADRGPDSILAGLPTRLTELKHRIVLGDTATAGAVTVTDLVAGSQAGSLASSPRNPDDVSMVLCTSGTTGGLTGVLHTPNTQYAAVWQQPAFPGRRTATPADLIHTVGLRSNLWRPLVGGHASVFADTRDPEVWLDLLARHRVSHFVAAPDMLRRYVSAQRRRRRPLPDLRITSTGAPLPAALVPLIREWLSTHVRDAYGLTETGSLAATAFDDAPDRVGRSLGGPRLGCEVRLDPGDPEAADHAFRLHVRGPSVCAGTFRLSDQEPAWDPAATDGWYDTGDLVTSDGHGGLRYLTRVADRVGGRLMIPVLEVEDELLRHPAVADVAVIGCPDQETGQETVCAVVVPAGEPPALDTLRRHLLDTGMTEWFVPARLECVDELPRNDMGKVRRKQLRDRFRSPGPVAAESEKV